MPQQQPAAHRAGREMQEIFSDDMKFRTWRRLWLTLAEAEAELGLPISGSQLGEMREHLDDINYGFAALKERELRQDVAAHLHAFAAQCPKARAVLALGADEAFVEENGELIRLRAGLMRIRILLANAVAAAADFAERYQRLPCRACGAPGSAPVTLGKRAAVWTGELLSDLEAAEHELAGLRLLGCRGSSGTDDRLYALFRGDMEKVETLQRLLAEKLGFAGCYAVSTGYYSRKVDLRALQVLAGVAVSVLRCANDMRQLALDGELNTPRQALEKASGLARLVMQAAALPAGVAGAQCLEQKPQDEACRRAAVPEAFLAADRMLVLLIHGLENSEAHVRRAAENLMLELPFLAAGRIVSLLVRKGLEPERARLLVERHAAEAEQALRDGAAENDLLRRIATDPACRISPAELAAALRGENFTALAERQTAALLHDTVDPMLAERKRLLGLALQPDD